MERRIQAPGIEEVRMEHIDTSIRSESALRARQGRRATYLERAPLICGRRHTRRLAPTQLSRVATDAGVPVQSTTPLPPPRAARTPRSRGFFLAPFAGRPRTNATPKRTPGAGLRSMLALVFMGAAIVTALVVGAPAAVTGKTVNANPGLSMVGSTLVTPGFLEPEAAKAAH
jgi:hypothetical protein